MFSQAGVILFTGGRVHPACIPPGCNTPHAPPPVDAAPPQKTDSQQAVSMLPTAMHTCPGCQVIGMVKKIGK